MGTLTFLTPLHPLATYLAPLPFFMCLLVPNVAPKTFFLILSNILQQPSEWPMTPLVVQKNIRYFWPMSSTYFLMPLVSFDIVSSALNIPPCPLLPQYFFIQPSTPHGVSNAPFWCPYCCLLQFCNSLLALLSFCCSSPSFIILGVV